MTRVLKLRLKLDDFIDTDFESTIMNKIKKTEDDLRIKIILYLWIDDTSDKKINLKDFFERWEKTLSVKTVVKNGPHIKRNEFIFFDIAPDGINYDSNIRFRSKYKFLEQIETCLDNFYEVTKFTTSDKNQKPQKRNDYAD
jgi:hypothetical protein